MEGAINYQLARHSYPGIRSVHANISDPVSGTVEHEDSSNIINPPLRIKCHTVNNWLQLSREEPQEYRVYIMDAIYSPNADQRTACDFSIDNRFTLSERTEENNDQHVVARPRSRGVERAA